MIDLAWQAARRILAVRLDSLGDVLMTTPAIRALAGGGADVTLLTSPAGAAAGRMCPYVGDVMVHEAPWMKATPPRGPEPDFALIERLRAGAFDAAVVFTVYSQNPMPAVLFCYLAGIPLRLAHARENPYQLLTPHVPETEPEQRIRHEVRRQLDLVATVGFDTADERMTIRPAREADERATAVLREHGIDGSRPWAILHPGASAPSRRYPHYAPVLRALVVEHGWRIVLTGDRGEAALVDAIREEADVDAPSLAGLVDLGTLVALIERAPVLVSNNTGPAHIAAAVGTPVVDLYALTNAQHTPWGVRSAVLNHDVPCRWCYKSVCPVPGHPCLSLVTSEQVVAAAIELVA